MIVHKRFQLTRVLASLLLAPFVFNATAVFGLLHSGQRPVAYAEDAVADTTAPSVSVTAPSAGATLQGTIEIQVAASDASGIASVQIQLGGNLLGDPLTVAPYTYSWDTTAVSNGDQTLSATATDASGNIGTADSLTVTIDNPVPDTTNPLVSLTAPAEAVTLSGLTMLTADASDDHGVASVQFLLDGVALGTTDRHAPYELAWVTYVTPNGSHTLAARATDTSGHTATSPIVHVTIQNEPDVSLPVVAIIAPPGGTSLNGPTSLIATAQDNTGIVSLQFKINNQAFGDTFFEGPYTLPWDTTPVQNGCYILSAVAQDYAGNVGTASNVYVVVNHNPAAPGSGNGDTTPTTNVTNTAQGEFQNCISASANSGFNTANGHDTPNPVTVNTGPATAGMMLPSAVNSTVTDINGRPIGGANGDTTIDLNVANNTQATLGNDTNGTATTGNNVTNANRESFINTGDASVLTNILNSVNTNIVNSNFGSITETIVDTLTGNINFLNILLDFLATLQARSGDAQFNLTVNNTSQGTITNTIEVNASTGSNQAEGDPNATCPSNPYPPGDPRFTAFKCHREATINTGDINIATNIVNLLNTNVVNSNWLFSNINILGSFFGDVILPGEGVLDSFFGDRVSHLAISNNDQAEVLNSVQVNGETGANDATGNRDGAHIQTGEVNLQTSVLNTVNTNVIGANFFSFLPHIFGLWDGGVVNTGGTPWDEYHTGDAQNNVHVTNTSEATIHNNIMVNATTGENKATGLRNAHINTGDINVATNLFNMANTNVIGSNWFLGHFNVFGSWHGNIVYAYPDLAVQNATEGPTAQPGEEVTYILHYQNHGLAPAKGVRLVDTIPANTTVTNISDHGQEQNGQITWDLGRLVAKDIIRQVSFTVRVNPVLPVGDTILQNGVTIATTTPEPETANNISGSQITVTVSPPPPAPTPTPPPPPNPKITIRKSNNAAGALQRGQSVTFSIDVTNSGNVGLDNLKVHDELPGRTGLLFQKDFPLAHLDPGQVMQVSYKLTVSADTATGMYTNLAIAHAMYNNQPLAAVQASSSVMVAEPPTTTVANPSAQVGKPGQIKGAVTSPTTIAGLVVTQTNNVKKGQIRQGDLITFIVTIYNKTKETLKNIVIQRKLVAKSPFVSSWNVGTLAPGRGAQYTYNLNLLSTTPTGKYRSEVVATAVTTKKTKVSSQIAKSEFTVTKNLKLGKVVSPPGSGAATMLGRISVSRNKGVLFFDAQGRPISAYQYAVLNSLKLSTILRESADPVDKQFLQLYQSGLSLVGKQGRNGKAITAKDVLNDLRQIAKFKHIFGSPQVATR